MVDKTVADSWMTTNRTSTPRSRSPVDGVARLLEEKPDLRHARIALVAPQTENRLLADVGSSVSEITER